MSINFGIDENNVIFTVDDQTEGRLNADPQPQVDLDVPNTDKTLQAEAPRNVNFRINDLVRFAGASDYEELTNKPSINGVELIGDMTLHDLGITMSVDVDGDLLPIVGLFERELEGVHGLVVHLDDGSYDGRILFLPSGVGLNTVYQAIMDNFGNYYTDVQIDAILDENYYTSDEIDGMLESFVPSNMIPILWADLVDLRDNGELVPGAYYRITDYNFVTTKASVRSGDHPFDIIVLAVSESMLSETAYAARHEGDHYFEREVTVGGIQWLYTLYVDYMGDEYGDEPIDHADDLHPDDEFVDDDVMAHPVSGDDVPVLYKTNIAEYDLDDPDYGDAYFYEGTYDFDGDDYDMWSKYEFNGSSWIFANQYALTPIVVEDGELIVSPHQETKMVSVNLGAWELKYCLDNDKSLFDWAIPEGKGVIYYMRDEFGNEAPYDFKNVMFQRKRISGVGNACLNGLIGKYGGLDGQYQISVANDSKFLYTYVDENGDDSSLFGWSAYNSIGAYIMDGKRTLNNIVLTNAIGNSIGRNCHEITAVGSSTTNNVIDMNCEGILMMGMAQNVIESQCRYLTFNSFSSNKVGKNFAQNMGASIDSCTFGSMNQNNFYGTSHNGNIYGVGCYNLTFGNYCYNNHFGNAVTQSTFGMYNSYNEFKGYNSNLNIVNYARYNTFEEMARSITLNTSGGNNSNYLQYVKVCKDVSNVTAQPQRAKLYEQIYYKTGRTETAV